MVNSNGSQFNGSNKWQWGNHLNFHLILTYPKWFLETWWWKCESPTPFFKAFWKMLLQQMLRTFVHELTIHSGNSVLESITCNVWNTLFQQGLSCLFSLMTRRLEMYERNGIVCTFLFKHWREFWARTELLPVCKHQKSGHRNQLFTLAKASFTFFSYVLCLWLPWSIQEYGKPWLSIIKQVQDPPKVNRDS